MKMLGALVIYILRGIGDRDVEGIGDRHFETEEL